MYYKMTGEPAEDAKRTDEMRCKHCGGGENPHPNVPNRRVCICPRVPKEITRYQDAFLVVLQMAKDIESRTDLEWSKSDARRIVATINAILGGK